MHQKFRTGISHLATAVAALLGMAVEASAQGTPQKFDGKIVCGSFSGDPKKFPAWTDDMAIVIDRGTLIATPGRAHGQVMRGAVGASGAILLAGEGGLSEGAPEWTYEFAGKLNAKGATVIRGQLADIKGGAAKRQCSISF